MARTPEQYEKDLSLLKVHLVYIVLILTLIIIFLVSVQWGAIENLVNYINFAATISSILLAIVAIIYSYYSNSSLSQSLGSLDASASKIYKSTEDLTSATTSLETKMNDIPGYMSGVEKRADQTIEMIAQMSNSLAAQKPAVVENGHEKGATERNKLFTDRQIDAFLKASSFFGLMAIYSTKLAFDSQRNLNMKSLSDEPEAVENMHGFIAATYSIDLVDYQEVEGGIYKVTYIHPELLKQIKDKIYLMAAKSNHADAWIKEITDLEALFGSL
ncbi:MAG TPA: hypothetical protein VFE50_11030, partial [Cyclobacteriaceae bacterium]|nr:hypothetical protein [Cyclobacteriaceae bacterium]